MKLITIILKIGVGGRFFLVTASNLPTVLNTEVVFHFICRCSYADSKKSNSFSHFEIKTNNFSENDLIGDDLSRFLKEIINAYTRLQEKE